MTTNGTLEREKMYRGEANELVYKVQGEYHDASTVRQVDMAINETDEGYGECPDCETGIIIWGENGYVPGSRVCNSCGSRFADSRYHAQNSLS